MSVNLAVLDAEPRLLFSIPLQPIQGKRFQPTGFPSLGAATYQTPAGTSLLVESAQSMANRLEAVCWDENRQEPVAALQGLSHVRVTRRGKFLTDTMLEAHRLNSPYLLMGKDRSFSEELKKALGELEQGPVDRRRLAKVLLHYDAGSLLHGVFLAKKDLAGGRLRVTRALSAFIEADGVRVAASGGVKNDHVNPRGSAKDGFGNVPFARDEFTAEKMTLYVNLDLALLRGYALPDSAVRMLILLALYKLAALVEGGLRLRTACDLSVEEGWKVVADRPTGWVLPSKAELEVELAKAIAESAEMMKVSEFTFEDELTKGTNLDEGDRTDEDDAEDPDTDEI